MQDMMDGFKLFGYCIFLMCSLLRIVKVVGYCSVHTHSNKLRFLIERMYAHVLCTWNFELS